MIIHSNHIQIQIQIQIIINGLNVQERRGKYTIDPSHVNINDAVKLPYTIENGCIILYIKMV